MRTTLDIDDDILSASKELGKATGKTAGQILSDLARKALTQPYQSVPPVALAAAEPEPLCGIRPLPSRGVIVTNELINRIRTDEGIQMLALLDVNVLIALFDVEHTAQQRAQQWLRASVDAG